uniref:Obg-like ATPase 1 n=1 Tax=Chromera velia CCMP2878 TaxID=1169474 RepID=A0A0G4H425_9ALVE|eukprot:Cvel_24617.t1-p1 / transcript=Cvel_24617.t1 / gene=Cvel_24617 / organism=Chromera_velia_CCMP2878 / gene_product=Obg-like ATPase 1, putative / transcript_product=Obg-like ATPase 1, putative / location=Cvel_scaffold2684:5198-10293(-) / protein_length=389 / sequence_SO=supercontig / SO=protein_coding / is_pseudo=false
MAPKKKEEAPKKVLLGRPKNNLRMGLVGLPNVGKSTTFNLLAKQAAPAENFPFCTIEPHEARMNVPDERFNWLCGKFKPKSEVPANLTIFDIAGLVPNAHQGEGLGNAFLANIQAVDAIYHVVRAFEDQDVTHTEGEVNPVNDLKTIADELRLKDIEFADRAVAELEKESKRGADKVKVAEMGMMEEVREWLKEGNWVSQGQSVEVINRFTFLTAKPVVYLVNMSEKDFCRLKNKFLPKISAWVKENLPGPIIPYSAEFELKLAELPDENARLQYIKDSGAQKSMLDKIIQTGYSGLSLIHFFTCGEDEVRCWTIREGTKGPQAAGVIHSDFERGFICAEVYKYADIHELGTEAAVKAAGKYMQKGKDYVVEDNDIIFFKFNVTASGKK